MRPPTTQTLLSALYGERRITLGITPDADIRPLSDSRALVCPVCKSPVVLHAGSLRARHFAHLPGAVCRIPQSEPETEEHQRGKILLAQWLLERLPEAEVCVEAFLPETDQRADVLLTHQKRRIALEFQCANLSAKEWRRRHALYRNSGYQDLWILGGSRLVWEREPNTPAAPPLLQTRELERALFWDNAPLLFLDATGERLAPETLARFRPDLESQATRLQGRLSAKPLRELEFPFHLLDWEAALHPQTLLALSPHPQNALSTDGNASQGLDRAVWEWLANRFRVTQASLPELLGLTVKGQEVFRCSPQAWQAAIYFRFVHRRVGDGWWLGEVETWSRAYLPLVLPLNMRSFRKALEGYQELLAAAGFLSLPRGYARASARIVADLITLDPLPNAETVERLARYRRTLNRG